jgi:hypothetical protein
MNKYGRRSSRTESFLISLSRHPARLLAIRGETTMSIHFDGRLDAGDDGPPGDVRAGHRRRETRIDGWPATGSLTVGGRRAGECRFVAHLLIADDAVRIDMSGGERFEAAHGDQAFPRSAISGVRAVPDCIAEVHGLKWAGTELPGIRVGSFHQDEHVTFAVCHGHNPGIVIDLANTRYDSVILTVENPEDIVARLSAPPG